MIGRKYRGIAMLLIVSLFGILTSVQTEYINLADVPCGRSEIRNGRIVGGQNATPREFPFLVSITRKGGHFCGGSILNSKFILTAAHCLCSGTGNIPVRQLSVWLGKHNLRGSEVPAARQEVVINAVIHPDYKCGKYVDDIALLELARSITWSESVKPACLPVATGKPGYSAFSEAEAVVAGWGWLGENRDKYKRADILQKVDVRVVANTKCNEWYANQNKLIHVESKQMCAGWEKGGKDTCYADSGGPLMVRSRHTGSLIVIGVVSAGIGCSRPQLPGIYTRVSDYISWITQKTQFR
ncbi:transmembrane protease serine 9-like [Pseudomyrmex gracilis]|uniref:transmembrane protease serine 9-like n=1 Tax=Pseudomyrmex gracilis TaxID=219809 RepID=UPI000994B61F|nr:transmembrane protease serine 9-like [Pseudomyrmex gracilis]